MERPQVTAIIKSSSESWTTVFFEDLISFLKLHDNDYEKIFMVVAIGGDRVSLFLTVSPNGECLATATVQHVPSLRVRNLYQLQCTAVNSAN